MIVKVEHINWGTRKKQGSLEPNKKGDFLEQKIFTRNKIRLFFIVDMKISIFSYFFSPTGPDIFLHHDLLLTPTGPDYSPRSLVDTYRARLFITISCWHLQGQIIHHDLLLTPTGPDYLFLHLSGRNIFKIQIWCIKLNKKSEKKIKKRTKGLP